MIRFETTERGQVFMKMEGLSASQESGHAPFCFEGSSSPTRSVGQRTPNRNTSKSASLLARRRARSLSNKKALVDAEFA